MATKMEDVLEQVAKLTALVQEKHERGEDPKQVMSWDEFKADFQKEIDELVEAKFQEEQKKQPQFRGTPGDPVTYQPEHAALKGNRYLPHIKSFEKDGYHNDGGQILKPVDLWIAHKMLVGQHEKFHAQQGGKAFLPSDDLNAALKALSSTATNAGDEWVPTNMAPQLWMDFFLQSRVAANLRRIPMPTNPFDVPLGLGSVTWRKGTENTATSQSNPTTNKSTLTATEQVTEQAWSYTLDEDAVVAMAPALREELTRSGAEQMDAFALNADSTATSTGNINLDDSTPAADAYYLSDGQDGIRHFWLVDAATPVGTSAGGDQLDDADVTGEMGNMGKYAADPSRLMIVCDVNTYLEGFLASGSGTTGENVITIDKFGPQAVVLTGQLAAYRGIPLVVSASHPLGEADGKVSATAASNTLGSFSIVNRDMWYMGTIRELLIEVDRDIQKRQYIMVTSFREAIGARTRASTDTHTGGVFNILV